jgi:hypothetical protein
MAVTSVTSVYRRPYRDGFDVIVQFVDGDINDAALGLDFDGAQGIVHGTVESKSA